MKKIKVKVTFIEELLGTASADPNIHADYIASLAPDAMKTEEEVAAIGSDAVVEKSKTIFPKDENGNPFVWDYQWKGYFKDACGALRRISKTECAKQKAFKKLIDKLIFVQPRKIPLHLNGELGNCQRPLRGSTPQGETIALANSETAPAGSWEEFEILMFDDSHEKWVKEMLNYGILGGTGQWRNSGKGRFEVEYVSVETVEG
jgi:hypothetical protein